MTINEFLNIVDPFTPVIINAFDGKTGESRTVADTRKDGDIPFDVLMCPIMYITIEEGAIVIEYHQNKYLKKIQKGLTY